MKFASLIVFLLVTVSVAAQGRDSAPVVEALGKYSYPHQYPRTADEARVYIPYFDDQNGLHWNDERVADAGSCSGDWFPGTGAWSPMCWRSTVMLGPRVDECRCTGQTSAGVRTGIAYVGVDANLRERWRRERHSRTVGEAPHLIGANGGGLVFSNLEVWSPITGKTIRPAATAQGSRHSCYLPDRNAFLEFDADVTLLHAKGGLYLRTADGKRELVLPVDRGLTGYYVVDAMAPVPGTPLVLLAEYFTTRGPGSARFEVFDLETKRVVFREEWAPGPHINRVRVLTGSGGHVVFSYSTGAEHSVVHFRIH